MCNWCTAEEIKPRQHLHVQCNDQSHRRTSYQSHFAGAITVRAYTRYRVKRMSQWNARVHSPLQFATPPGYQVNLILKGNLLRRMACCCSQIIKSVFRTSSSHSGAEEYPTEKHQQTKGGRGMYHSWQYYLILRSTVLLYDNR